MAYLSVLQVYEPGTLCHGTQPPVVMLESLVQSFLKKEKRKTLERLRTRVSQERQMARSSTTPVHHEPILSSVHSSQ